MAATVLALHSYIEPLRSYLVIFNLFCPLFMRNIFQLINFRPHSLTTIQRFLVLSCSSVLYFFPYPTFACPRACQFHRLATNLPWRPILEASASRLDGHVTFRHHDLPLLAPFSGISRDTDFCCPSPPPPFQILTINTSTAD